jgi:hypothetical protein
MAAHHLKIGAVALRERGGHPARRPHALRGPERDAAAPLLRRYDTRDRVRDPGGPQRAGDRAEDPRVEGRPLAARRRLLALVVADLRVRARSGDRSRAAPPLRATAGCGGEHPVLLVSRARSEIVLGCAG